MKKLFLVFVCFIFSICLIGCNKKKVYIDFIIDGKSYDVVVEKGTIISNNIIPLICNENNFELYYDKEQKMKYNNEEILNNITIYVNIQSEKEKELVTITYKDIIYCVEIKKGSMINENVLPFKSENKISLYLDETYKNEYNNEVIYDNVFLYLKSNNEYQLDCEKLLENNTKFFICQRINDLENYISFPDEWNYFNTNSAIGYPISLYYDCANKFIIEVDGGYLSRDDKCIRQIVSDSSTITWDLKKNDIETLKNANMDIMLYNCDDFMGYIILKLRPTSENTYYIYKINLETSVKLLKTNGFNNNELESEFKSLFIK